MGSKVICPLCENEGYLVFETRKKKIMPKIRDIWKKRDQYPDLTDERFASRIAGSRNILKKEYTSKLRIRQPYAKIIHRVKKNGKWINVPHYLGKLDNYEKNVDMLFAKKPAKGILDSKIPNKMAMAFKEAIANARYNEFKDLDTPTNQVLAEIIALRHFPYAKFHKNTEEEYHCPKCNNTIELVIDGYKIRLEKLKTIKEM